MTSPTPPSSRSAGGLPFVTWCREALGRMRYRRGELRRLAAVRMEADAANSSAIGFEWTDVRVGGVGREALCCPASSRAIYDVVLLQDAVVHAWCGIDAAGGRPSGTFLFDIEVNADGRTAARSVQLPAGSREWQALTVAAPAPGPARIVLRVRPTDGVAAPSARALWAHPRIESPRPFADVVRAARATFARAGIRLRPSGSPRTAEQVYDAHVRTVRATRSTLRTQRAQALRLSRTFTLITVLDEQEHWETTADSVLGQSYVNVEWLVATSRAASSLSMRRLASRDRRVRIITVPAGGDRPSALTAALAASTGEFVGLVDAGDTLSLDAVFEMSAAIERGIAADVLYSDEDLIARGRRVAPVFKPDWSPERLLSSNYIGRLALLRREAVLAAGGFREQAADAEWDLLLRLGRSSARFHRVPRCLYHRGDRHTERRLPEAACADVASHIAALGRTAQVSSTPGGCRVTWPPEGRLVSIVMPNRDALAVLRQSVEGVLHRTEYPDRELIIVDNDSTDPDVLAMYDELQRSGAARIVPFPGRFNFSAACNRGAAAARGDRLLFLNNDVEVVEPGWLAELVRWADLPEIGVVGAKLLYPDRTIQHAGVVFGIGLVGHIFARAAEGTATAFGSPESYRNYLAVTGACQMMRREVFEKLGGFDERFRLSFSDVVLCMEAWKAGYRVVYTPYARLVHHESYSRKKEDSAEDMLLLARYLETERFTDDPFFHPELDPKSSIPAVRPPLDAAARQVVSSYVERVLATAG